MPNSAKEGVQIKERISQLAARCLTKAEIDTFYTSRQGFWQPIPTPANQAATNIADELKNLTYNISKLEFAPDTKMVISIAKYFAEKYNLPDDTKEQLRKLLESAAKLTRLKSMSKLQERYVALSQGDHPDTSPGGGPSLT